MLAGLPVVVTDQVGLAADVSKFEAGIVIPACDSDSLANAIDNVISAKSLKMAQSAKELAKNEYGFNIFSERLNDFYSIKSYAE
jgi:glycosyltransferase involved in cell wall biosynthesis